MAANITMLLPQATAAAPSFGSLASMATTLLQGTLELVISIGIIAAYSHILCFATGLVLRDEQSLELSNDPDLPKKEQTAALMLTGFLGGIHVMMIFVGLSLFGHEADSFLMKNFLSCAVLAAVSTGLIIGGIALYLIAPAFVSCGKSVNRRIRGSPKELDAEATVGDAQAKDAFLDEKFADGFVENA